MARYIGHYILVGTGAEAGTLGPVETDPGCRLTITTTIPHDQQSYPPEDPPPTSRLFVPFSLLVPWVLSPQEEEEFHCND